ncbi:MAG TPA: hypothetical protein PK106_06940 [Bacteroidales bacterium]|nr:hypothetical protein [Bacteroidales bacterium]
MSFPKKIPQILLLILVALVLTTGCSSTRKNPYYQKRIQASKTNTKQLGKNRYYFSDSYQKKLQKSYKRK